LSLFKALNSILSNLLLQPLLASIYCYHLTFDIFNTLSIIAFYFWLIIQRACINSKQNTGNYSRTSISTVNSSSSYRIQMMRRNGRDTKLELKKIFKILSIRSQFSTIIKTRKKANLMLSSKVSPKRYSRLQSFMTRIELSNAAEFFYKKLSWFSLSVAYFKQITNLLEFVSKISMNKRRSSRIFDRCGKVAAIKV